MILRSFSPQPGLYAHWAATAAHDHKILQQNFRNLTKLHAVPENRFIPCVILVTFAIVFNEVLPIMFSTSISSSLHHPLKGSRNGERIFKKTIVKFY
jgi:hypothetical protein